MSLGSSPAAPTAPATVVIDVRRPRKAGDVTHSVVRIGLIATDMAVMLAAALVANRIRFDGFLAFDRLALVVMMALPLMILASEFFGLYRPEASARPVRGAMRWITAWTLTLGLVLAALFFSKTGDAFSRLWVAIWYLTVLAFILPVRIAWAFTLRQWILEGRMGDYIGLAGGRRQVEALLEAVGERLDPGVVLIDERQEPGQPLPAEALHELAGLNRLVLLFDPGEDRRIEDWLGPCRNLNIAVDLAPPFSSELLQYEPHSVGGLMVWRMATRPLSSEALVLKRLEDLLLGLGLLVVALPLMALIALAVRLDTPGPILFRQRRHGFNGREFTVLKFRSMTAAPQDDSNVPQARRNDPRITRVGAFIRRTSLDELPQLFNVMRGDMSLVGPRPHAIAHNEAFGAQIEDYLRRHRVKPGITGWAQVNGYRGETETIEKMAKRIEMDLYYIDNWSLALDMRILLRTIAVAVHPNAY